MSPQSSKRSDFRTFDPAKYLDGLLSMGRKVFAIQNGDRIWLAEEMQCRALSALERSNILAACEQFNRAPNATNLVIAECIRRGMVQTGLACSFVRA